MAKRVVGWYRAHVQPTPQAEPCRRIVVREQLVSQAIVVGDTVQVDDATARMRVVSVTDEFAVCEWRRRGRHGYELARARYALAQLTRVNGPILPGPAQMMCGCR